MNKLKINFMVSFLLATYLCICGQGIAYFLNEHFLPYHPVHYLTGLTVLGILLYLVSGFLLFRLFRLPELESKNRELLFAGLLIVAPGASLWSFFVTIMWWG